MPQRFYAVARGRRVGIFATWPEAESQIIHYPNAIFKKFNSRVEADWFLQLHDAGSAGATSASQAVSPPGQSPSDSWDYRDDTELEGDTASDSSPPTSYSLPVPQMQQRPQQRREPGISCPVCLEDGNAYLERGLVSLGMCGHVICEPCSLGIFDSSDQREAKTCPVCRDEIYEEDLHRIYL